MTRHLAVISEAPNVPLPGPVRIAAFALACISALVLVVTVIRLCLAFRSYKRASRELEPDAPFDVSGGRFQRVGQELRKSPEEFEAAKDALAAGWGHADEVSAS